MLIQQQIARVHNYDEISFDRWKSVVVSQLLWEGIPCIYYGDELGIDGYTHHDSGFRFPMPWDDFNENRKKHLEVYKTVTRLRHFESAFSEGGRKVLYADGYTIAISRFMEDNMYIGIISVASWGVPHSVGPRFPGPLLIRTRCPDTSPNSSL